MRYFTILFLGGLILPALLHLSLQWTRGALFSDRPPGDLVRLAQQAARRYGLDHRLLHAVIDEESAWRVRAVSVKGAIGLGQLMPQTARELGVDPYDPAQNLDGSARYLAAQLQRFGTVELALCAYHAGPAKVLELGRCPNFPDTRRYVRRVLKAWQEAQADAGIMGG